MRFAPIVIHAKHRPFQALAPRHPIPDVLHELHPECNSCKTSRISCNTALKGGLGEGSRERRPPGGPLLGFLIRTKGPLEGPGAPTEGAPGCVASVT